MATWLQFLSFLVTHFTPLACGRIYYCAECFACLHVLKSQWTSCSRSVSRLGRWSGSTLHHHCRCRCRWAAAPMFALFHHIARTPQSHHFINEHRETCSHCRVEHTHTQTHTQNERVHHNMLVGWYMPPVRVQRAAAYASNKWSSSCTMTIIILRCLFCSVYERCIISTHTRCTPIKFY